MIFLTLSYVTPVACSLLLTKRQKIIGGKWHLGAFGVFCNIVSIGELPVSRRDPAVRRSVANLEML